MWTHDGRLKIDIIFRCGKRFISRDYEAHKTHPIDVRHLIWMWFTNKTNSDVSQTSYDNK